MEIKQVVRNGFWLYFDNGLSISTIWGAGSYSTNHDLLLDSLKSPDEKFEKLPLWAYEVEVMLSGEGTKQKEFLEKVHEKYDGDGSIIGYLPVTRWFELINELKEWKGD